MIIYFDIKSDELKELPESNEYQWFGLTSLKGCVGLYGGDDMYGDITLGLDVWIMEQDGRTRLMKNNCNNSYFRDQSLSNIVLLG
ncbi:hypothetical protein RDI58_023413 [Solanum bulbocastanum]|uniref:F-box protein n=1 Tax=Solanum bulbocastanum TaxID=147425 RepID=A0AAN8T4H8_SOLBU